MEEIIPIESIISKIFLIRNQKVILDSDIANLYGIPTKVLLQAVKRNYARFPSDFMFQLTQKEFQNLRSQFVTSSWGGRRYNPFAFTEHGVAMLSSVLNSEKAIEINILIIRSFVKLREIISTNKKIEEKLKEIDARLDAGDERAARIIEIINQLLNPPEKQIKKIGFEVKEKSILYKASKKSKRIKEWLF